ncbi:related to Peptide transporter PTR2 [Hanseniaspora guilliermondii]|uniref:Related to Peptide transporter PTR2 n=1 Tax=Hanseniaspora guilliermondii TaxID=56406 RepID=A0A1L0AXJ0_9ASCO|nr:related to Peptide transporter PTR2 [Hanseniaspora guilliermondii]
MSSELSVKDIQNSTFDNVTSESSKDLVVEKSNVFSATSLDLENVKFDEFIPITEEEKLTLPYKIKSGKLPWYIYLMLLVEFAERASYYCCNDRLSNLVELPMPTNSKWGNVVKVNGVRPKDANAGALGKGLSKTNSITNFLSFAAYCFPLVTSVICDIYCKKMTMLFIGCLIGIVAHVILMVAVIPGVLAKPDTSYGLLYLGVLTLAWCSACIKPILLPLLLSQYKHETDVVTREANDEIIILDRDLTLRRQTQWFYFAVNIGGFVSLGAGYLARDKGYFYAFLLPLLIFAIIPFILIVLKPKIKDPEPAGKSIIQDFFKIMKVCLEKGFIKRFRNGTFFEYALPSNLAATQNGRTSWLRSKPKAGIYDERTVTDIKLTLSSSRMFLYWVIFYINDLGLASLINNLSAAMKSNGVPNDVINNFNPLAIIVFTPILDYGIYPLLTKMKMNPNVTIRIFIGFMLAAGAMAGGAILQRMVYNKSPCGDYASTCDTQANISLWETCVIYGLTGIGETFAMVGGYQIAFVTSPSNMRSFVMAIFLFQTALSSIISIIISPSLKDPNLVKVFGAIAGIGAAFAFWWLFQYWNLPKDLEIIAADLLEYEQEMAAMEEKRQLLEMNDKIENGEIEVIAEKDMELNPVVSSRTVRSNNAISPVVSALESAAIKK